MAARTPTRARFHRGPRSLTLPIRTERLLLRPPADSDVERLVELMAEPSVARGTLHVPFPYRRVDAVGWVRRAGRRLRAGSDLSLTVERRDEPGAIGGIGLHQFSEDGAEAELGYWIGRPYRRQGFARESVEGVVDAGFHRLGLHRIVTSVFPFNRASASVLRGTGFRREGLAREVHRKDGEWRSEIRFARLVTDPTPAGSGRKARPARRTRRV